MQNGKSAPASLPYVNRIGFIALTIGINLVCVLLSFGFRPTITESNFLINIFVCGFITTLIDALYARYCIARLRRAGQLPAVVPTSRLIRMLPTNVSLLTAILGVLFGAAALAVNWLLIRFFAISDYTLWRIAVWQALFACGLSSIVMQLVVLRMVQPDCALPDQPEQHGEVEVLNPLPRFDALKSWFDTVTSDFGFNMVVGMLFGGVVIIDQNVVIYPTLLSGIAISSIILSIIVVLRMVYPVIKSIAALRGQATLPFVERPNRLLARLPLSPAKLTVLLTLPVMLVSYGVLNGFLTLFDFQSLHFFQYFIVRTAYVALLTKAIVAFAVARYRQPELSRSTPARGKAGA